MQADTDRTWDLPKSSWMLRMTWSELMFAHWPVDPQQLERLLPRGLTLDTYGGHAWLGVVPFAMSDVAPRFCPTLPKLSRFLELNVRTYVTLDDKPGVWFFSLDAANRLAVRAARGIFCLPYMDASMSLNKNGATHPSHAASDSAWIHYRSNRTHRNEPAAQFDGSYRAVGESFRAQPGSLEHWLTARYCLYSANRRGRIFRGEIDHEPWKLSRAECEIRLNSMCEPLGVGLIGEPHLLCAQPIMVQAWLARPADCP